MEQAEEFSELSTGRAIVVGMAAIFALGGLLIGLAGLLMWGIMVADVMFPNSGDMTLQGRPIWDYLTLFNFVLMLTITLMAFFNLSLALRWSEFLAGGWKRYAVHSLIGLAAAILFVMSPHGFQSF